MQKIYRFFILVTLISIINPITVYASCGAMTYREAYEYSDVVFIGKINEVNETRKVIYKDSENYYIDSMFDVSLSLKGDFKDELIKVSTSASASTTIFPKVGATYLVFATYSPISESLLTNICVKTTRIPPLWIIFLPVILLMVLVYRRLVISRRP